MSSLKKTLVRIKKLDVDEKDSNLFVLREGAMNPLFIPHPLHSRGRGSGTIRSSWVSSWLRSTALGGVSATVIICFF